MSVKISYRLHLIAYLHATNLAAMRRYVSGVNRSCGVFALSY